MSDITIFNNDLFGEVRTILIDNKIYFVGKDIATALGYKRPSDAIFHRAMHGTTRAIVANMVKGVSEGYEKKLLITGTGYKAELKNGSVVLNLGYSHQITMVPPTGITYTVPKIDEIHVTGIDKELVGQCAAEIRAHRRPEPYHGKGIRYSTEVVRRKEIKKAAK